MLRLELIGKEDLGLCCTAEAFNGLMIEFEEYII